MPRWGKNVLHFATSHPPLSSLPFEVGDEQKEIIIQHNTKKGCSFCLERFSEFQKDDYWVLERFKEGVIKMLLRAYKLHQPSVKDTQTRIF